MKTNIKLRVTPEQSEAVQKICFANGIEWMDGRNTPMYLNFEYLFIESNNIWGRNVYDHNVGSNTEGYTEVDANLFIRTNGTCEESIGIVDNLSNNKSKEDMFEQYGFEVPDFDCAIFSKVNNNYIGYATMSSSTIVALSWALNGIAYMGVTHAPQYNLTPIKKPWYETCKYPILLTKLDGLQHETYGLASHCNHPNELCVNNAYEHIRDWRPLSNEEIDQLKQDF